MLHNAKNKNILKIQMSKFVSLFKKAQQTNFNTDAHPPSVLKFAAMPY